jgi:serine/threonine protein phosphatase PrpC
MHYPEAIKGRCPNCGTENRAGARFCAACGCQLIEQQLLDSSTLGLQDEPAAPDRNEAGEPTTEPATAPGDADVGLANAAAGADETDADGQFGPPGSGTELTHETGHGDDNREESTLEPLEIGAVLLDRYEIVELKTSDDQGNVYTALDRVRCSACGFADNAPDDEYCADCGASLTAPPVCEIWEQPATVEAEPLARFMLDGRRYVVVAATPDDAEATQDGAEPRAMPATGLRWAARTDPGQVRELNEDTVDVHVYSAQGSATLGLFIVADGVGGQAAGEVASRLATDTAWASLRETIWLSELQGEPVLPETMVTRVEEAVQAANQAVYQRRREQGNDMGTTMTLALVHNTTAVLANVGDSRTYRWNAEGLQQLTQDHSLVQSLINAGGAEPADVYTHPQRNVIYRSIGDRPRIEVDTALHKLAPGDRLVLCSDGLWEMARDEGIEEVLLREPDPDAAAAALVRLANLAGGTDNIAAIVAEVVQH